MALEQCLKVTVTLNPAADSRERVMNTWHIATVDGATPSQAFDAFTTALNAFYQGIDVILSNELSTLQPDMYGWNYIEVKPRQPFDYFQATALTTATSRSPRELACVLSYRAQYVSGVSPKRRRGRIYIGPLGGSAIDTSTGKFTSTVVNSIQGNADTLLTASQAATTWKWVVYSPTTDVTGTGETGMYEVIGGWVDDTPDTQRRRGVPQGARTSFS